MKAITLSQLAKADGGQLVAASEEFSIDGYSTDTRSIGTGDLFFCLSGDNFDGHDFVQQAVSNGAGAVVVERHVDVDVPQLVVKDTRRTLGYLAKLWRAGFSKPIVGVTGSNGKTTVKQMLASIFDQVGSVQFTRANDNNEIGVPQTLLGLKSSHDHAVIEMGASHLGEIEWLGELVQPDVAVITNASAAHLEGFGDAQAVASEKAHIYKSLSAAGTAVINADDKYSEYWLSVCEGKKVMTFGSNGDVSARRLSNSDVEIEFNGEVVTAALPLSGEHNVQNAAAAAACCIAAGLSLEEVAKGLAAVEPVKGRLNIIELADGVAVIDDTYNANPASTRAAIDVLGEFNGKRFLVLGDLLELGAEEQAEHEAIGRYAKNNGVDALYAFGALSKFSVTAFGSNAYWFSDKSELTSELLTQAEANAAILVKGSRSMKMEQVVAGLCNKLKVSVGVCCQ